MWWGRGSPVCRPAAPFAHDQRNLGTIPRLHRPAVMCACRRTTPNSSLGSKPRAPVSSPLRGATLADVLYSGTFAALLEHRGKLSPRAGNEPHERKITRDVAHEWSPCLRMHTVALPAPTRDHAVTQSRSSEAVRRWGTRGTDQLMLQRGTRAPPKWHSPQLPHRPSLGSRRRTPCG